MLKNYGYKFLISYIDRKYMCKMHNKQYEILFLSQARKEPYPMYFRYFFLINNM